LQPTLRTATKQRECSFISFISNSKGIKAIGKWLGTNNKNEKFHVHTNIIVIPFKSSNEFLGESKTSFQASGSEKLGLFTNS
jgi:hypothetical protein